MPRRQREMAWSVNDSATQLSSDGSSYLIESILAEEETRRGALYSGVTVGKIRGWVHLASSSEASVTPGTFHTVSLGLAVVQKDLVGASPGDAQIPDPFDDQADWLWRYKTPPLHVDANQPASYTYPFLYDAGNIPIETRTMRKLKNTGMTVALIAQPSLGASHEPSLTSLFLTEVILP